jgi:hypothetical protein
MQKVVYVLKSGFSLKMIIHLYRKMLNDFEEGVSMLKGLYNRIQKRVKVLRLSRISQKGLIV